MLLLWCCRVVALVIICVVVGVVIGVVVFVVVFVVMLCSLCGFLGLGYVGVG